MIKMQLKLVKCSLKGKHLLYLDDKVTEKILYKIQTQSRLTRQIQVVSLIKKIMIIINNNNKNNNK